MLCPQLFDAICREISIESCTADFELIDDVADEWVALGVLEHGLGVFDGFSVHRSWSTATPSTLGSSLEACARIFDDEFPLEFIEGSGHVEKQPPF